VRHTGKAEPDCRFRFGSRANIPKHDTDTPVERLAWFAGLLCVCTPQQFGLAWTLDRSSGSSQAFHDAAA
jgi:hypothetical protein